jgi:hypothetical protein
MGQLAFFADFLETSGLFEQWLQSCPLRYTSPSAPKLVDVPGTWLLGSLDGHSRYAHIGTLRGDGVYPEVLGMNKIIGDDSLRRPTKRPARSRPRWPMSVRVLSTFETLRRSWRVSSSGMRWQGESVRPEGRAFVPARRAPVSG